jgi:hypothetical protein
MFKQSTLTSFLKGVSKVKAIKILKGLLFIATGLSFFLVKTYNIVSSINLYGYEIDFRAFIRGASSYNTEDVLLMFNNFFQATGINVILAFLFIGIGILELLELKGVKTDGN